MLREKIRKKLKSEQGTSIFFGLLLFLVASILSVVMLEGAVTTVKTVASDRESEQNQLSCTSAAQVLRDSIINIKLSAMVTVKKDTTGANIKTNKNWNSSEVLNSSLATPTDFADLIQGYLKELDAQNENVAATEKMDTLTKKLTLSTSGAGSETAITQFKDLNPINTEVTIKRIKSTDDTKANEVTYDITVRLSTGNGSDSSRVILSLTGKVKQTGQSVTTTNDGSTEATTYEYTWKAEDIMRLKRQMESKTLIFLIRLLYIPQMKLKAETATYLRRLSLGNA